MIFDLRAVQSRAMPFFLSLVSSEGLVWANGPMGVGRSDDDTCLAPDTMYVNFLYS